MTLGDPTLLGASLSASGCNFSVYAPHVDDAKLALFNADDSYLVIPMHRHGDGTYTVAVENVHAGTRYGYFCQKGAQFQWILDPYAGEICDSLFTRSVAEPTLLAKVVDHRFDWQQSVAPNTAMSHTALFELHVKGFTQQHLGIAEAFRGTYLGLCQPEAIAFFQQAGITALQLLPVAAKQDEPHLLDKALTNYWGYNPVAFFAPDARFAIRDPVNEFKQMVRELHRHGIEVILDVVFNHTAEGGSGGPVFHQKWLDPEFYLRNKQGSLHNYTGCGNTVDLSHPPAMRMVMDALRHWVSEYHIDGFRFDLAATLGRHRENFCASAAFFQAVYQDPILRRCKLIAEPWDIGPNGYQLGQFPLGWHECNDKFRDNMRSFWHGTGATVADFATRLMGSRDLFSAANWPQKLSVNYITYHDGFTLQDLVSYQGRHNCANGEGGRDGHGDNHSDNHGVEGPTDDLAIQGYREHQKRNLMASLLFSFGVPHLLAADHVSHSQQGNNNAYCQDNALSWLDWAAAQNDTFGPWLAVMMDKRHRYMVPMIDAFCGENRKCHRINWTTSAGLPLSEHDWHQRKAIQLHMGLFDDGQEMLYLINPTPTDKTFTLPAGKAWTLICDTSTADLSDSVLPQSQFDLAPYSMAIGVR
uniref:glycogen debranching protein GlgX n=1 Tax=Thaumasiovibrio occultus TaxID=1891184 RepID=UPI000B34D946|nr:glycogen debranching protein GlgX [Thaumasiovibrio occultus]